MITGADEDVMEELETLAAQVDELQSTVTTLTGIVERLGGFAPTGGATAGGDEPQLYFPDVEAFVTAYFLPMYGWRVDGQRWHWCPRWWDHAEVIWRMETLWRSWESYRLQATGMSSWRLELDGQMPLLLGPEGPMAACRPADAGIDARHETGETPKAEPAPSGWWG